MSLLSRIHARTLLSFPNSIAKTRTVPIKSVNKTSLILSETRVNFFSTTQPKKFWPQLKIISMILINPILRYSSWAVGKILKKHWGRLPLEQRLDIKKNYFGKVKILVAVLFCVISAEIWNNVVECPITGRKKFLPLSDEQMEKYYKEFDDINDADYEEKLSEMLGEPCKIIDSKDNRYEVVEKIVTKILKSNEDISKISNTNWNISVVDSKSEITCALPNGKIFIFTGIFKTVNDDDQLALLLSHEIAHVILNHSMESLYRSNLFTLALYIPFAVLGAIFLFDFNGLLASLIFYAFRKITLDLPFAKSLEAEANEVGNKIAQKAGFKPLEEAGPRNVKEWQDLEMSEIPEYLVKKSPCDYRVRWTLINLMMDKAKSKEIEDSKFLQTIWKLLCLW